MKKGKPVPIEEVPKQRCGSGCSPNEELFQEALRLNGSALPIEFDSAAEAMGWARSNTQRTSRAIKLGLKIKQRGRVLYLLRG